MNNEDHKAKSMNAALSEQQLHSYFDNAGDAIYVLEIATGRIRNCNLRACRELGYGREELLELSVKDIECRVGIQEIEALHHSFKEGEVKTVEGAHKRKDGSVFPVEIRLSLMGSNQPQLVIAMARDITERKKAETALKRSEEKFRTLHEISPVAICLNRLDDGRFVEFNHAIWEMTGYTEQEFNSLSYWDITPRDYQEAEAKQLELLRTIGRYGPYEKEYIKKDGTRFPVLLNGVRMKAADGTDLIYSVVQDISELKKKESALKESEALLLKSQEIAHLGSWELDVDTSRLTWSDEVYRIFGLPRQFDANYEAFLEVVHPDDRAAVHDAYSTSLREKKGGYEIEHRLVRSDTGEIRYVHEKCTHVKDASGRITRSIGMVQDITERKRAEEALRKGEERLRFALEASRCGAWELNLADHTAYHSPEHDSIFGYTQTQREWTYEIFLEHVVPEDRAMVDNIFRQAVEARSERYTFECRIRRADGQTRWIWMAARQNPNTPSIAGIVQDVTERKEAEEERLKLEAQLQHAQKLESLGILAVGIAHDFNNLMTGLFGYIESARRAGEKASDGTVASNLDKAMGALDRAKALTQQLLTFSKGGAPVKKPANVSALLREATEIAFSGSNIELHFHVPGNLWLCEVDRNQFIQAVDNILINARDAMLDGGTISITTQNIPPEAISQELLKPGRYVLISIKDSGPGIPAEFMSHLFDPFFTTKEKGHGLGLPMAYSIIKKHGGLITAESRLGEGATFHIHLPATLEAAVAEPAAVTVEKHHGKGKILVMDDEPMILDMVSDMLQANGYLVGVARNGEEAIRAYQEALNSPEPFSAVILDLTVRGGMGGKDTIKKLLEIDSGVKVLVSSGYSNDPIMTNPEQYGFKGAVGKPFRATEMSQVLGRILDECSADSAS